jgi:large subunit ribosomal protein L4
MIYQKVIDIENKEVGKIELADAVFGVKPKKHLLKDVVVMQMANRRQGTHSTLTRKEVRGGGKKPFRQKGTGNARQGTSRSPLMPGGGIAFGPKPRDYSYLLPKKVRKIALKTAMILKRNDNKFYVLDKFELNQPKTKNARDVFEKLNIESALIVDGENKNLALAVRNLPKFKYIKPAGLNVYDLLKFDSLIMTKDSVHKVEERLLK